VIIYGLPALLNIITAMVCAIAGEALFRLISRQQPRIKDLSAGISGLLLALVIPPAMPLWMTALGSLFAVIVAKEFFGGLGANVFNPALTGRAFLMMSFPAAMTTWRPVQEGFSLAMTDAVSSPSPLQIFKSSNAYDGSYSNIFTEMFQDMPLIKKLFFGYHEGCTGETSILLILAGFVFLAAVKVINWRAPAAMVVSAAAAAFALGMNPVMAVLSGGLLFGAVFMATDYATTPLTAWGKIIFGIGAGIISVLIRKWGGYPEGVSYAILIMNAAVPFLNKILPKKYGFMPKKKAAKKGADGGVQ